MIYPPRPVAEDGTVIDSFDSALFKVRIDHLAREMGVVISPSTPVEFWPYMILRRLHERLVIIESGSVHP